MITKPLREVQCRWFFCLAATLIIIMALVPSLSAQASEGRPQGYPERIAVEYQDTLLSVEAQKATLLTVFEAIADKTQYEFVVPEELLQREVTLSCSKTDLDKAVKRVLDASGVRNYALVSSVKEADTGSKSVHQIEVVLFPAAHESAGGESSGEKARVSRLQSDAQTSVREEVPVSNYGEEKPPASGSTGGIDAASVPMPGPVSTDLPQPGPVCKDLPQPGPVTTDLPQPGPVTKDLPQPGPVTNELP